MAERKMMRVSWRVLNENLELPQCGDDNNPHYSLQFWVNGQLDEIVGENTIVRNIGYDESDTN